MAGFAGISCSRAAFTHPGRRRVENAGDSSVLALASCAFLGRRCPATKIACLLGDQKAAIAACDGLEWRPHDADGEFRPYRSASEDRPLHRAVAEGTTVPTAEQAHTKPYRWASLYTEPEGQRFAQRPKRTRVFGVGMPNPPRRHARRKAPDHW